MTKVGFCTLTSTSRANAHQDDDTNSGLRTLAPPDRDSLSFGTSVSQKGLSPEPPAAITAGQRRGRRKVMKKKTIKDEEGYLGSSWLIVS